MANSIYTTSKGHFILNGKGSTQKLNTTSAGKMTGYYSMRVNAGSLKSKANNGG